VFIFYSNYFQTSLKLYLLFEFWGIITIFKLYNKLDSGTATAVECGASRG